ncbi:MAG: hypothetical protein ACYTF0_03335, partial [Planctomycetota bacterium]
QADYAQLEQIEFAALGASFTLRPAFKVALAILGTVLLATVLAWGMRVLVQRQPSLLSGRLWQRLPTVVAATLVVLALSGFATWLTGRALHGWLLLIHNGAGALYGLALTALAVGWLLGPHRAGCRRAWAWLMVLASAGTVLSAVAMMLPLASTTIALIIDVHRWAAVVASAAAVAAWNSSRADTDTGSAS